MITNLHQHTSYAMCESIADTILAYIKQIKETEPRIKKEHTDSILKEMRDRLIHLEFNIDYNGASGAKLNQLFTEFIDMVPKFNKEQCGYICDLFSCLDYKRELVSNSNGTPVKSAFEPQLVFRLLNSGKISDDNKDYFLQRILKEEFVRNYSNKLKLNNLVFTGFSSTEQSALILQMIDANLKDPGAADWAVDNMRYFEQLVVKEDFKELGSRIFMNTLKTRNVPVFKGFFYGDSPNPQAATNLKYLQNIRAYMCGGHDKYAHALQTAESLDLVEDRGYWLGVISNVEPAIETFPDGVEF